MWVYLKHYRFRDAVSGSYELFWMLFFGFMPLWFGLIFFRSYGATFSTKFFTEFVNAGELLIVSVGLVGPLMYPIVKRYSGSGTDIPYPLNGFFVALIVFLALLASLIFCVLKGFNSETLPEKFPVPIDKDFVRDLSYWTTLASLIVAFKILSVRNLLERLTVGDIQRSDTDDFVREFRR